MPTAKVISQVEDRQEDVDRGRDDDRRADRAEGDRPGACTE
jgi:hypothetical protein